ncbi:MAG TPA: amidohydrolase [Pirellulales bacterium]|nr:amidohydrolase [Pirellulales bacterium]
MLARAIFYAALATALHPRPMLAVDPSTWAHDHLDELVRFYRQLHQAPELSFHEEQTAETMAAALKAVGCKVTTGIGGYGVVGILENGAGPKIMIRADMDALPVVENTQLAYASTKKVKDDSGNDVGVMHACGHDIHMTCLVGVARYLAANKDRWSGTIMFLCQPAEERGSGAAKMLKDGCFDRFFKPEYSLALHVDANQPTGTVGFHPGYTLANVDSVDITLYGKGGHGAYPHATIDPIVQAARLILDLQTIVSREVKPTEPAVITVGSIHGGAKHNVIGDTCHLQITVRSFSDEVRKQLLAAIRRKALAAAQSSGAAEPKITVSEGTPAMYNDPKLVERIVPVLKRALGEDKIVDTEASMGGEDYSEYGRAGVPIFMFQLGSVDAKRLAGLKRVEQNPPSLHSPLYYPDAEETIQTGITAMSEAAIDLLPPKKK